MDRQVGRGGAGRRGLRGMVPTLAALALAGCSLSGEISQHALDYNQTVADAENQMLLLNIVRSAKRYPRHYTRIANLDGSLKAESSLQLVTPFGPRVGGSDVLSSRVAGSSNPTFSMQLLNTQEFYNGILAPVDVGTLDLFLSQGWPERVLYNMFVEQADVAIDGPRPVWCKVASGGSDYGAFARFNMVADLLDRFDRTPGREAETTTFGPALRVSSIEDLERISKLRQNGFDVKSEGERVQLTRKSAETRFRLSGGAMDAQAERRLSQRMTGEPPWCGAEDMREVLAQTAAYRDPEGHARRPLTVRIHMRSADAMVHYAGELARAQLEDAFEPRFCGEWIIAGNGRDAEYSCADDRQGDYLVKVVEGGGGAVSITHEGAVYSVPRGEAGGRTMQVLALIQQVFSLNVAADETPARQTVRFITQ